MKRTITIAIIIFFIILFSILSLVSINKSKHYVFDQLDKIEISISNNDFDKAFKQAENLNLYWDKKSKIFSSYIEHDNIEKTTEHITLLIKSISLNDNINSILEIENVKFYINLIYESELPMVGNIL